MRQAYLEQNLPELYTRLIRSGKLDSYLADDDQQAAVRFDTVLGEYKRLHGTDEQLKAEAQMRWIQTMDPARAEAEQNVLEKSFALMHKRRIRSSRKVKLLIRLSRESLFLWN